MRITLRGLIQLIAILLRLATMQGAHSELKWDFSNSGERFPMEEKLSTKNTFTNRESVTKDAHRMIFTFLLRSNHISKTITKSLP